MTSSMTSSIIDNDEDIVFYEFAAQGSLHYGLLMLKQAREYKSLAILSTDESLDMAKADALARHAKDYMHGAAQTIRLLISSFPEDTASGADWKALENRALVAMSEAEVMRKEMDTWAEKFAPDLSEYTAKAHVQWLALLSNRSLTKEA